MNMHQREDAVSLMKKFMTENTGAGPGLKKLGCQTRAKNVGARPKVNPTSLKDRDPTKRIIFDSFKYISFDLSH